MCFGFSWLFFDADGLGDPSGAASREGVSIVSEPYGFSTTLMQLSCFLLKIS